MVDLFYKKTNSIKSKIDINKIVNKYYLFFLLLIILFFIYQSNFYINYLSSWLDEGNYLMKSWWYVTGKVKPYSSEDSTSYMPFYFYILGYWQRVFGVGHVSGRLLSSIFGIGNLLLIFYFLKEIFRNKMPGIIGSLMITFIPMTMRYWNTATPYSIVSFISLLCLLVLVKDKKHNWMFTSIVLGLLLYLLYFIRPNMIVGIGMLFIFQIIIFDKVLFRLILVFSVFIVLSFITYLFFPSRLIDISLALPFISQFLHKHNIYHFKAFEMLKNTFSMSSGLKTWNSVLSYNALFERLFNPYFVVVIFSIAGTIGGVIKKDWENIGFFSSLYFIVMASTHFIGSQTYSPTGIQAYVNYFISFGVIGAVYGLVCVYHSLKIYKKIKYPAYLTISFVVITLSYKYYFQTKPCFICNEESLIYRSLSNPEYSYIEQVNDLSELLKQNIPENEKILQIGTDPLPVQAIYLSGFLLEMTSINQNHSYRKLKNNLSHDREKHILDLIKSYTQWTDDMMNYWIRNKYNYIVIGSGFRFTKKFFPLIMKYFSTSKKLILKNRKTYYLLVRNSSK